MTGYKELKWGMKTLRKEGIEDQAKKADINQKRQV